MSRFGRLLCLVLVLVLAGSAWAGEKFSIAVLPDTQQETGGGGPRFAQRMSWLVEKKDELNLKMVLQVGDLANWDTPEHDHFVRASEGLAILDAAKVPYVLTLGNHDTAAVKVGGSAAPGNVNANLRITTTFNSYFPTSRFAKLAGVMEEGKVDNAFHRFSAGGLEWLVVNLELWPRKEVVEWAKGVVEQHPKHNVIILTHSYLTAKGAIEPTNGGYGNTSPQYLFDNLISVYPNVRMVFCGHTGTHAYRKDEGRSANSIYQFLQCYHDNKTNPVRLVEIDTEGATISSRVYCPFTNEEKNDGSAMTIRNVAWVK